MESSPRYSKASGPNEILNTNRALESIMAIDAHVCMTASICASGPYPQGCDHLDRYQRLAPDALGRIAGIAAVPKYPYALLEFLWTKQTPRTRARRNGRRCERPWRN